ncbi:uncharacterized protein SOCE26_048610 [Sorangium cellulosum]|uniref:Uncharacterized protein n=1 Tax=Sorangium cellulosum TaxID=56 RepID=A0A2L0EVS9_SORCE|nr:hypothetical protein [Sorangium cellulosum]AUX43413.1 uncharacterized protein SOCE26_048610 [Sorangium cellulosum]
MKAAAAARKVRGEEGGPAGRGPDEDSGPVSVVLPADLRERVQAEARRRGLKLSPAIRALLSERVQELDDAEQLSRAEEWQRAQVWSVWERMKAGDHDEASRQEIDSIFDEALRGARRPRAR